MRAKRNLQERGTEGPTRNYQIETQGTLDFVFRQIKEWECSFNTEGTGETEQMKNFNNQEDTHTDTHTNRN